MFEDRGQLARTVAGAFRILDSWNLRGDEVRGILGFPFGAQIAEWRHGTLESLPNDVLVRLRHVIALYRALKNTPVEPAVWLRLPIAQFGHQTPLDRMVSGDPADLLAIVTYVKTHQLTSSDAGGSGAPIVEPRGATKWR